MFLDDSSSLQQDYPWWEDTNLSATNLPEWIHYYKINPNFLFPQPELKRLTDDFSKCDIALVCGWGPIIAHRAGVPFLFYSYGSDLTVTRLWENIIGAARKLIRLRKPNGLRSLLLYSRLQRNAIRCADRIGILMGFQINPYVKELNLVSKMAKLRLAWEIEKYGKRSDLQLAEKYRRFDVVYFMISRHMWRSVWEDMKGNDKFIRAYARFVKERKPNALLVTIEKGYDVQYSKQLVEELQISNYVEWVKEMNKDGIRSYISLDNVVVVDQFWHNNWHIRYPENPDSPGYGLGSASIEALSAECTLITGFFHEDFYEGNRPPILSAFSEEEIYQRLCQSLDMGNQERKKLGRQAYEFVKKYHGWENVTDLYINTLKEILEERALKTQPLDA